VITGFHPILKVMVRLNIHEIPEKYFIDRWRKKAKKVQSIKEREIIGDNHVLMFKRTLEKACKNNFHCF
jgi:hypothetical protein